ncbi:hypothetical protein J4410_01705, partial [Candidatus Woesearchaeota archaeon]|nr:hypothetical protein [Candidatus Woesearchaeota archaeon]
MGVIMGNKIHVLLIIVIALAFLTSCTAPQNEITGSAIQQQDIPEESITTNASSEAIVSAAVAEPSSEDIKAEPIENEEASVIDSQTIVEKTNAEDTNAQPSAKQLTEETPAKETFNHIPDDVLNNYDKICSKISFVEYKNKCYTQAASLKKDIEICKKVDDSTYLDTPECYSTIAYVTGNKSICDNVKSRNAHYICISGVAIATNNETICNDQESFVMKEDCIRNIAAIRHDAELCNKLQQKPAREWCYALVAQATGNKELCNNISKEDTLRRLGCKMALLDKQYYRGSCLGLGPELARDYCFYAHEESTKNMKITEDYELCNGASTDFKQKAACLANLAYVNGNPSYCNELNVTSDHDFCVRVAAGTKREVSYCYNLTVDVQHDLCIADVAVYTKNLTLC